MVVVTDFCLFFPARRPAIQRPRARSPRSLYLHFLPLSLLFFHFSFLCAWPNPTVHTSSLPSTCVAYFDRNRKLSIGLLGETLKRLIMSKYTHMNMLLEMGGVGRIVSSTLHLTQSNSEPGRGPLPPSRMSEYGNFFANFKWRLFPHLNFLMSLLFLSLLPAEDLSLLSLTK